MPRTYNLDEHFERFIDAQLASGRYSDPKEVVQAGLRLLEERQGAEDASVEEIRSTIEASRRHDRRSPADEVFQRIEAKIKEKMRGQ